MSLSKFRPLLVDFQQPSVIFGPCLVTYGPIAVTSGQFLVTFGAFPVTAGQFPFTSGPFLATLGSFPVSKFGNTAWFRQSIFGQFPCAAQPVGQLSVNF